MNKIHLNLNRLVDYHFSIMDFGWPPSSILHRISTEGHVDRGRPGSSILCPHMPADLIQLQRAFLALKDEQKQVITVKYMPYYVGDERRKASERDRASFMGLSTRNFRRRYMTACKNVMEKLNARKTRPN